MEKEEDKDVAASYRHSPGHSSPPVGQRAPAAAAIYRATVAIIKYGRPPSPRKQPAGKRELASNRQGAACLARADTRGAQSSITTAVQRAASRSGDKTRRANGQAPPRSHTKTNQRCYMDKCQSGPEARSRRAPPKSALRRSVPPCLRSDAMHMCTPKLRAQRPLPWKLAPPRADISLTAPRGGGCRAARAAAAGAASGGAGAIETALMKNCRRPISSAHCRW